LPTGRGSESFDDSVLSRIPLRHSKMMCLVQSRHPSDHIRLEGSLPTKGRRVARRARVPCKATDEKAEFCPDAAAASVDSKLVCVLTSALPAWVELARAHGNHDPVPSVFRMMRAPMLTVSEYFVRLHKHLDCSNECFIVALIYIERLIRRHPELRVDHFTWHKMFLTACVVALKYQDDKCYSNEYYANVGGVSPSELNTLEAAFLRLMGWHLFVGVDEFSAYREMLAVAGEDGA